MRETGWAIGEGALVAAAGGQEQKCHGDGLGEFAFEVPAGRVARVREKRVDALGGLLGLSRVDGEFSFVALFADGENAERRDGFEGVIGPGMAHAEADGEEIDDVDEDEEHKDGEQDACEQFADGDHARDAPGRLGTAAFLEKQMLVAKNARGKTVPCWARNDIGHAAWFPLFVTA